MRHSHACGPGRPVRSGRSGSRGGARAAGRRRRARRCRASIRCCARSAGPIGSGRGRACPHPIRVTRPSMRARCSAREKARRLIARALARQPNPPLPSRGNRSPTWQRRHPSRRRPVLVASSQTHRPDADPVRRTARRDQTRRRGTARRQAAADRSQPQARRLDCEALFQPRPVAAGSDPGRQHRAHEGGRSIPAIVAGLRSRPTPPGGSASRCRAGGRLRQNDSPARACGRSDRQAGACAADAP